LRGRFYGAKRGCKRQSGIFRDTAKGAKEAFSYAAVCLDKPAPNADGGFGKLIGTLMIGKEIAEFFEIGFVGLSNEILKKNYYTLNHELSPGLY